MPIELNTTILARELESLKKNARLGGKIAGLAISFLEKYFGTYVLLYIPPILQETNSEIFDAIKVAEQLQNIGILKKIEKHTKLPDEPFLYYFSATSQKTKHVGIGTDFFNEKTAFLKAIYNTIGRSLRANESNILKSVQHLPYGKISSKALDIFKLNSFSEEQKKNDSSLNFNNSTVFGWVPAKSLSSTIIGETLFCPAQLISDHYLQNNIIGEKSRREPILCQSILIGLKTTAGNLEEAIVKGILEIIEQNTCTILYSNKIPPPVIDFEYLSFQDEELEKVYKMFKRYNLKVYLLKLPTNFSANVISAVILDKSGIGPAFAVGSSAGFDLKLTIFEALEKSLSKRLFFRGNLETDKKNAIIDSKKKEFFDHPLHWAKPKNEIELNFITQGEKIKVDLGTEGSFFSIQEKTNSDKYYKNKLKTFSKELRDKAYQACYIEISTPKIKRMGFCSVQVVIPELQQIILEGK